jgi:hypothetical protein
MRSYRSKTELTEDMDPSVNVDFNDKGVIKLNYKSIRQLRDFFLDGTEIEIVERKISYRSKDYVPPSASSKKTNNKDKKSKDDGKKAEDASKKKKKKNPNVLDNYNVLSVEDREMALFKLDLHHLLDGSMREMKKKYAKKQELRVILPEVTSAKKKDSKAKEKAKESVKSKKDSTDKSMLLSHHF